MTVQGGAGCPEGHLLALAEGSLKRWWCDLCEEERERTEAAWRCSEDKRQGRGGSCDFDVCTSCVHRHQVSVRGLVLGRVFDLSRSYICLCQEKEEEAALSALTGTASILQEQEQEDSA